MAMFVNDLHFKVMCLMGRHSYDVVRSNKLSKRVNPQYIEGNYGAPQVGLMTEE